MPSNQFQTPSGSTYVRYTSAQPRVSLNNNVSTSGVYIPQGRNIPPVRSQIPVNQSMPQQVPNRVIIGNSVISVNQPVMSSYPPNIQNIQNLRY